MTDDIEREADAAWKAWDEAHAFHGGELDALHEKSIWLAGYRARAAEQTKDEVALVAIQQTLRFLRGQPCMADSVRSELSGIRHALDQEYPSKPEP